MNTSFMLSLVTLLAGSALFALGCGDSEGGGNGGSGGAGAEGGGGQGAGGTSTDVGTDTGTGTATATDTVSDTFTETCVNYESTECDSVMPGDACSTPGAYCEVEAVCGNFPTVDSRYMVCFSASMMWEVIADPRFTPSCFPQTATDTSIPTEPCPCAEPQVGSPCGSPFPQAQPCAYTACEEYRCDAQAGEWVVDSTCG